VIAAKKRLFIDKPLAGSLRDAVEIFRLAREANVPVFTASAYRYYDSMVELQQAERWRSAERHFLRPGAS
jgi:predicted dehydrogenase